MKRINKLFVLTGCIVCLLMASCNSSKKIVYLQDMDPGVDYPIDDRYEATVQCDDRLSITVSCKNPELAIPFNIYGGFFKLSADGSVSSSESASKMSEQGYRVDAEGYIDFPILGKLHVAGLKVSEVQQLIKDKLIEGSYMNDPMVSIEFLNFRYTVLGAVPRNGTFNVEGDRITLLEAIANAGDLQASARIDRVTVIREENGERKMYVNDLRSRDIFESPCFYLQQNDIVYVVPKYKKKDNEERGWQIATTLISVASVVCTIIWATK